MNTARLARPAPTPVVDLVRARIERALPQRQRYKYVQPRVVAARSGWQVLSPNCSRNVRADGGEILIAWLQPAAGGQAGLWHLHARDHGAERWRRKLSAAPLAQALALLCDDTQRQFWQ